MLHKWQIVSTLATTKQLSTIALHMRNFIANFVRILGICKEFAGNRVNEHGNVPRCGVVPNSSDLEVIALGITAEAFGFDSENLLFIVCNMNIRRISQILSVDGSSMPGVK